MAGIYIPGGELPKEGHWLIITHDGEVQYVDFTNPYRVLPEKAMEVKDHGKLIDADELGIRVAERRAYEAYLRGKREDYIEEPLLEYLRGRSEGLTEASGLVRFAPTIIPVDRKEGETCVSRVKICPKCGSIAEWDSYFGGTRCTRCDFVERPKPSNADCIRAMTDEELARLLTDAECPSDLGGMEKCKDPAPHTSLDSILCRECWLDWLRQEAE